MKLRIYGNSVRLRLRKSEVAQLAESGEVSVVVEFAPDQRFTYALRTATVPSMAAAFDGSRMVILIPEKDARNWALGDIVSLKAQSGSLSVLVEKDFRRTSQRDEDDFDRYPNPRATASRTVP